MMQGQCGLPFDAKRNKAMTMQYDPSSFTNKAEEAGFDAGTNANFLASAAATIMGKFAAAKGASRQSLEDLRAVGEALNEAKDTLKDRKGAFGEWCEASGFPFDKTWRARLMKLAANWDAIMEAVQAHDADRKSWSVDGVLGIWQAAQRKAKAAEGGEDGEGSDGDGEAKPKAKRETEAEKLRRMLAEAMARIETLEAALAGAQGGAKEGPKAGPKGPASGTVDAAMKARAKKVWGLFTRGGTDGEKGAAKSRLDDMAAKCGLDFDAFVKACGLSA